MWSNKLATLKWIEMIGHKRAIGNSFLVTKKQSEVIMLSKMSITIFTHNSLKMSFFPGDFGGANP